VLVDAAFFLPHALFFCPIVLLRAAIVLVDLPLDTLPFFGG
jgi:hypothetical protein